MSAGPKEATRSGRTATSTLGSASSGSTPIDPQASAPASFRKPRSRPTLNLPATAGLERDAGGAAGRGQDREGAGGDLGRVVVRPALDHDADLDRDRAAVAGPRHRPQEARVVELALAGDEELVLGAAAGLVLEVGVDRVRRQQRDVALDRAAHDLEVGIVEVEPEARRADRLDQPGDPLGQVDRLADVRLERDDDAPAGAVAGQ